jgi:hypothetical protein
VRLSVAAPRRLQVQAVQLYTYVRRVQHQEVLESVQLVPGAAANARNTHLVQAVVLKKVEDAPQRRKDHVSVERWKLRELEAHPLQASMPVLLVRQVGFLHVQLTPTRLLSPDGRPFFPARRCRHRDQQPAVDAQLPLANAEESDQPVRRREGCLLMCS